MHIFNHHHEIQGQLLYTLYTTCVMLQQNKTIKKVQV